VSPDQGLRLPVADGPTAPNLEISCTAGDGGVRLIAAGEIDRASAPALHTTLQRAIASTDGPVVVDLGAVSFIDSSGVNALVVAREAAGSRLRLGATHHAVRRVLEITALLELFGLAGDAAVS
jgi:anti-sigma B factor antagonist